MACGCCSISLARPGVKPPIGMRRALMVKFSCGTTPAIRSKWQRYGVKSPAAIMTNQPSWLMKCSMSRTPSSHPRWPALTPFISVASGPYGRWTNASDQEQVAALWREIARRYHDEPTILAYEVLNEPDTQFPSQVASLNAFHLRCI